MADLPEVGCLLIPTFALACELSDRPELRGLPAVIALAERPVVMQASSQANAAGVYPGQSLSQAMGFCPQLTIIDSRPAHYSEIAERLLLSLQRVVCGIENNEDGIFYLDFRGLQLHHEDTETLAQAVLSCITGVVGMTAPAHLGMASQKFVALVAARLAIAGSFYSIAADEIREVLQKQSIDCLPADPDTLARLRLFGITTLRQLTRIPKKKFLAEFGPEGDKLWLLAAGRLAEPLQIKPVDICIQESADLESPIITREQLLAIVHQLAGKIGVHPQFNGRAARQVRLTVTTERQTAWEKIITFKHTIADPREISRLLCSAIAQIELPGPVIRVALRLGELTMAAGIQAALPNTRQADEERLHEGLRQLRVRYGSSHVFRPLILEDWSQFLEDQCILLEHDP